MNLQTEILSSNPHLDDLNPPQREAVEHHLGPILVLAGAGSGKTRVLTRRIAHLVKVHRESPRSILAVTFTNKAAGEMKERLKTLLPEADELWVSTFHSTALRILRYHASEIGYKSNFVIYDSNDSKNVMTRILKRRGIDVKSNPPSHYLRYIDRCKNEYISVEQAMESAYEAETKQCAELYQDYQQQLLLSNAMDFGDLLFNLVALFEQCPDVLKRFQMRFKFVLVDEFQDTNHVQYRFLKLLVKAHKNLLVVGDDDQSIYAFRGANISNILHFEKDYSSSKVVKLVQNYRSTKTILEIAYSVIKHNKIRKEKKLWTDREDNSLATTYVARDETDEARFIVRQISTLTSKGISLDEIAIFYRTNAQSRAIEEEMVRCRIPYQVYGGLKFYDRKEIKDLMSYLRLLVNPRDFEALFRVINTPPRGIGAKSVKQIADYILLHSCDAWQAIEAIGRTNKSVLRFQGLLLDLSQSAQHVHPGELIRDILVRTGYSQKLLESDDVSAQSRLENLEELAALASHNLEMDLTPFEQLTAFLDKTAMVASNDQPSSENGEVLERVSMMTLHLAKGLEYEAVFFTGLEDGLLPHYLSQDNQEDLEEERRLMYVGITRAKSHLFLTRARSRLLFSRSHTRMREPSSFLGFFPQEFLDENGERFCHERFVHSYEYDDDAVEFLPPKKPKVITRRKSAAAALMTADSLDSNIERIPVDDLDVGLVVLHSIYGTGTVESIEKPASKPIEDSRVTISFDPPYGTKRLVYRFAGLQKPKENE